LFFLGTLGYQTTWQNPDSVRKQVLTFSSTIVTGRTCDAVGRKAAKSATADEPFSFYGFQFLLGRKLIPTSYSLQNGTYQGNAMMNWRFEGSNDMINWNCLDMRKGL
jgi:hypothetical protein